MLRPGWRSLPLAGWQDAGNEEARRDGAARVLLTAARRAEGTLVRLAKLGARHVWSAKVNALSWANGGAGAFIEPSALNVAPQGRAGPPCN
jgi:hypothetical protein